MDKISRELESKYGKIHSYLSRKYQVPVYFVAFIRGHVGMGLDRRQVAKIVKEKVDRYPFRRKGRKKEVYEILLAFVEDLNSKDWDEINIHYSEFEKHE